MSKKQEYLNLPKSREVDGKTIPYMSYSQYTSFNEIGEFHYQMVLNYLFGIKLESRFGAYAEYGTACGEHIEDKSRKDHPMLNSKDKGILGKYIDGLPEHCQYEREIWLERKGYFILGYEDVFIEDQGDGVEVIDAKTGSIVKKGPFYASDKYGQTNLYAYFEDTVKKNKIKDCKVIMFDRVGNAMKEDPDELHLSGQVKDIPTPYSRERAEKVLAKMDATAVKLASLKTTYDALKTLTFKF